MEDRGRLEDPYLKRCVDHLRTVVEGWEWSVEMGVVLVDVLHIAGFVFDDGFVLNGDDHETVLGRHDAAKIVAEIVPLSQPRGWSWWLSNAGGDRSLEFSEGMYEDLVHRIGSHPTVIRTL